MPDLVAMMQQAGTGRDFRLYNNALNYLLNNHHANGYAKYDISIVRNTPFLKIEGKDFPELAAPSAIFANPRASIMGYNILPPGFRPHHMKFGVLMDPPIQDCANRLVSSPPKSHGEAAHIFGYMAGRLAEVSGKLADSLGSASFVPVTAKNEKRSLRYSSPAMVFLGDPETYGDILDFVDFGQEANSFLLKVGSKHEPSSVELARMVIETPAKILGVLGQDKYMDLLRKLAENQSGLKNDKAFWKTIKEAPFLLASREVFSSKHRDPEKAAMEDYPLDDEEPTTKVWSLAKPSQIIVPDTIREYLQFRDTLLAAPADDVLESFYVALGVPLLSALTEVERRSGQALRDQTEAQKLENLLVERSRVFLHEYSRDLILHDAKWVERYLTVTVVQSLSIRVSLKGYNASYTEKRTASMAKGGKGYNLLVTSKCDLYE
ncbi:hypothetical protein LTS18_012891, partial [Coniosporium uncinatum]